MGRRLWKSTDATAWFSPDGSSLVTLSYPPALLQVRNAVTGRYVAKPIEVPIGPVSVYLSEDRKLSYVVGTEGLEGWVAPYDLVSCDLDIRHAALMSDPRPPLNPTGARNRQDDEFAGAGKSAPGRGRIRFMARRRVLLFIHLTVVLFGLGYLVFALSVGRPSDANIGAGLAALWLIALGSPWGWPLLAPGVVDSLSLFVLLAAASALLNLGPHAVFSLRRDRS